MLPRSDALTLACCRSPTSELQTVQEALSACQLSHNSGRRSGRLSGQNTRSSADVLGHNSSIRTYDNTQWSKTSYQSTGNHHPTPPTAYAPGQTGFGTGVTSQGCHVTTSVSPTISSQSMLTLNTQPNHSLEASESQPRNIFSNCSESMSTNFETCRAVAIQMTVDSVTISPTAMLRPVKALKPLNLANSQTTKSTLHCNIQTNSLSSTESSITTSTAPITSQSSSSATSQYPPATPTRMVAGVGRRKNNWYSVIVGRCTGVFNDWQVFHLLLTSANLTILQELYQ